MGKQAIKPRRHGGPQAAAAVQGDDGGWRMREWSDTRKRIPDPSVPPPEFSSAAAAAAGADVGASMDMRMERRVARPGGRVHGSALCVFYVLNSLCTFRPRRSRVWASYYDPQLRIFAISQLFR